MSVLVLVEGLRHEQLELGVAVVQLLVLYNQRLKDQLQRELVAARLVDFIFVGKLEDAATDIKYVVFALDQVLNGVEVVDLVEEALQILLQDLGLHVF